MTKLVRWYKRDEESLARVQFNLGEGWKDYKAHPHFGVVGDYRDTDGTPGYKMFQYLLKNGYSVEAVEKHVSTSVSDIDSDVGDDIKRLLS